MPPCQPPWWSSFLLGEWTKVWCPAMKKWKGTTFLAKVPSCEGAPIKNVFFQDMLPSGPFSQRMFGTCFSKLFPTSPCAQVLYVFGLPFFQRLLLGYLFSKGLLWVYLFSKGLLWGYLFSKGLLWSTVFPTSSICSNLVSKGLLFGLGTGCLGSNAASLVGQLLQLFHCVLYLLGFVGSFLKHRL